MYQFSWPSFLQKEEFQKFASDKDAYEKICSKIAPSIFGHVDVKKAVACLLFGGSRKVCHFAFNVKCSLFIYWFISNSICAVLARWCKIKR